jgi:hypothetical protein
VFFLLFLAGWLNFMMCVSAPVTNRNPLAFKYLRETLAGPRIPVTVDVLYPFVSKNIPISNSAIHENRQFTFADELYSFRIAFGLHDTFVISEKNSTIFRTYRWNEIARKVDGEPASQLLWTRSSIGDEHVLQDSGPGRTIKRNFESNGVIASRLPNSGIHIIKLDAKLRSLFALNHLALSQRSLGGHLRSGNRISQDLGLSLHPLGLGMNVIASLFQKPSLPDHCANLQPSNCNSQCPNNYKQQGEDRHFPLYLEILAALLACLITCMGGGLWGFGHRILGGMIAVLGLACSLSVLTSVGFCDPFFWRPFQRVMAGQNPYRCQWTQQTEYRETLHHDAEM